MRLKLVPTGWVWEACRKSAGLEPLSRQPACAGARLSRPAATSTQPGLGSAFHVRLPIQPGRASPERTDA